MEEHSRKPLEIGHNIGGYDIVRVIGQGGFGIVYEAINKTTRERVAIKQFYPNAIATWKHGTIVVNHEDDKALVAKVLRRFEDEAALQFNFQHPNILRVKNFIRADNTGYMITDYVDGGSLLDVLRTHGSFFADEDAFRRAIEPVLDALRYVHERGTLHRDISPDNIMIDASGKPILVDFGAAKFDLRASSSASSVVQYREDYAPIEQQFPSADRPEGYYTDIFAVAGTMYRALSGKPPARAVARALEGTDPYVPIAAVAQTRCRDAVYSAIDRGLAMKATARPATISEFLDLLGWQDMPPRTRLGGQAEAVETYNPAKDILAATPESAGSAPPLTSSTPWVPGMMAGPAEEIHAPAPEPAASEPPPPVNVPWVPGMMTTAAAPTPPDGSAHTSLQLEAPPLALELPHEDQSPLPAEKTPAIWPSYLWAFLIVCGSIFLLVILSEPDLFHNTTAAPPRSTRPIVGYVVSENSDLNGTDLLEALQPVSTDQQGCEAACNQQGNCFGYSFDKWAKHCRLKEQLTSQRFQPGVLAAVRMDQPTPPSSTSPRSIESIRRAINGNRYSTSNAASFRACSAICEREDTCLGFQFVRNVCWRYDRIDELTTQEAASGIKHQAASP